MSKRHPSSPVAPINLPRRLREGLADASELLNRKKPVEAKTILEELVRDFPRQEDALGLFANACLDTNDRKGYLQTLLTLHKIRPGNPEYELGLAGSCLGNGFLALALQMFEHFLGRWPGHPKADDARKAIAKIREGLDDHILGELGMEKQKALAFSVKFEEQRLCLETGQHQRGKSLAKELLEEKPDFAPARNNLSQIYWLEGDNQKAIETCKEALALDPDNIHALSNIVRLLYLSGRKDEAQGYLALLKASKAEAADRWKKIAEVLSFIGDDQGMLEVKARAQQESLPMELDAAFYHFIAVSELMLEQEREARSDWGQAMKLQPGFPPAQANLDDLKLPKHKRNGPWAHSMAEMISGKTVEELISVIQRAAKNKNERSLQPAAQHFLNSHPEILQLAPLILERGEAVAKELILKIADMSAHPDFLALLKDFAFGQAGSDKLRLDAAQTLSKHNAAPNGMVDMWLKGKWTPILLLGFEITPEPIFDIPVNPKALALLKQSLEALRNDESGEAERILRRALQLQPEHPSLLNNLALALAMQDKHDASEAIRKHLVEDFPNYFLGQISQALKLLQDGDVEKARAIVNHWMETKKKFHTTEFSALCKAQINLMLEDGKPEGADSWLKMWERVYPDDPELEHYEQFIKIRNGVSRIFRK